MADQEKVIPGTEFSEDKLEKVTGGIDIEDVKKIRCCKCQKEFPSDQMRYENGWMCPACWNKYWGF